MEFKFTTLAKKLMSQKPGLDFSPTRATAQSAGFDLSACIEEPITIWPGQIAKIPTGVHIWLNGQLEGSNGELILCGLYLPRSSTPGLCLTNTVGLLDNDYQGESFFKYINRANAPVTINPGDRIGQIVVQIAYIGHMEKVNEFDTLTDRGKGGFGSTGK